MADYTNTTNVSRELNGFTINSTTTPSTQTVSEWIEEASAEVDLMTGKVWGYNTASSEYYDYDGSGYLRLNNAPIITVSEFLWDSTGLNGTATWTSLTEGRAGTDSFIVYKDEGELMFHGNVKPTSGYQNLCVSYTYGYQSVPLAVQQLTTKIVARRLIKSVVDNSATNEGGTVSVGTITVSDPSDFGSKRLTAIDNEINELVNRIGSLKTYRITRRGD